MKHITILILLCLLLTASGCTATSQEAARDTSSSPEPVIRSETERETMPARPRSLTPTGLTELLEITNQRRETIIKPAPDTSLVADWNIVEREPDFDPSVIMMDFRPSFSESDVYSPEQVQADLNYLFYFYELGYGPFFYFGGKEAFDHAKQAIWDDLEQMDEITAPAFEASLVKHLSFVKDAHFVINRNHNYPRLEGYLTEQAFDQNTEGFSAAESGRQVLSINGREDFADQMVLSVTPEGKFTYRYCFMHDSMPEPPVIVYDDGSEQTAALFSSHEAAGAPEETEQIVSYLQIDGIPVINITSMGFPHANDDGEANRFLELAEELKEEPVLIIDLRRNGGGNGLLPQMWYEAYTGTYITPNHYNLFRMDMYNAFGIERNEPDPESFYYIPADINNHYTKPETINESWVLENGEPREIIDNDRLLIILTSKGTASAADNFTDMAFNIKNTLVIGSNTTGMFTSAAAVGVKMPESGMVGQMGFNLSVFDDGHFREGVGFMPDLWVSGDALDTALALAKEFKDSER